MILTDRQRAYTDRVIKALNLTDWKIEFKALSKPSMRKYWGYCQIQRPGHAVISLRPRYGTFARFKMTVVHELLHVRMGQKASRYYAKDEIFADDTEKAIIAIEKLLSCAL